MDEPNVMLAHGNGGRRMRELIEQVFVRQLGGPSTLLDAAQLPPGEGELLVTTDGFIVQPLEFPGGDIGSLAVHGTVNDLAVSGAQPLHLTVAAIIEEGLPMATLERLVASLGRAAQACGVAVVAGDTKVAPRGSGGGLYLTTTGLGRRRAGLALDPARIGPGDALLVSGPVGDHGTAVLLAREAFGLRGDVRSDSASVWPVARSLLELPGLRFMRDPTRGGLATVAHELAHATGCTLRLWEAAVPVRAPVRTVCALLGYDPYYLACEGRLVAVVAADQAEAALARLQEAGAPEAALIGRVEAGPPLAVLTTALGGERVLEELEDDPLPRIC